LLQPGDQIDIWAVENALGAGGMGSVYRCHNRSAPRILAAVKVLESSLRNVPGAEERFIREAEILFSLDHPNIVKVRNVRTDTDPPYLEMEFVEGSSLESMLQKGALAFSDALAIMRQLADALAYLHELGVRHRDVKPANLLVNEEGRLTLVDFGLAMEADQTRLTQSNTTFGTVSYAPPEWIKPEAMDPEKWDIYASGVVFWEMLKGQVAFPVSGKGSARQQAMQVIIAKQDHPPLDPGEDFHDDLRELISDMTQPDMEKRPRTMSKVRDRVKALVPRAKRTAGQTIAPLHPWEVDDRSTWVDASDSRPARDEWVKVLAATPVPAEPRDGEPSSEAATVVRDGSLVPATGRSALLLISMGAAVVIGVGLAVIGVGWVILGDRTPEAPPARAVDAVVSGVTPGTEVALKIGDTPSRSRVSWVYRFGEIPIGETTLAWAIGKDCPLEACPGAECPTWCGTGSKPIQVEPGEGTQTISVPLAPPPQRTIRVTLPELDDRWPVQVSFADTTRAAEGGEAAFDGILPGRHPLRVDVGDCEVRDRGCHPEGQCGPGCISWQSEPVVAWGEGEVVIPAEVEAPAPIARPVAVRPVPTAGAPSPEPPPPEPTPEPAPPSGAGAADQPVTHTQYATWLASHPDWHREAATASGLANDAYLTGWSGTSPPADAGTKAVINISWYAAAAYCKGRGGLADVDAEPLSWEESPAHVYLEWRTDQGRAAWRSSDGRKSTQARLNDANSFTGFRCTR
jgi:serine/threonine-protein kinase